MKYIHTYISWKNKYSLIKEKILNNKNVCVNKYYEAKIRKKPNKTKNLQVLLCCIIIYQNIKICFVFLK